MLTSATMAARTVGPRFSIFRNRACECPFHAFSQRSMHHACRLGGHPAPQPRFIASDAGPLGPVPAERGDVVSETILAWETAVAFVCREGLAHDRLRCFDAAPTAGWSRPAASRSPTTWTTTSPSRGRVVVEAEHLCMSARGVRTRTARTMPVASRQILRQD